MLHVEPSLLVLFCKFAMTFTVKDYTTKASSDRQVLFNFELTLPICLNSSTSLRSLIRSSVQYAEIRLFSIYLSTDSNS